MLHPFIVSLALACSLATAQNLPKLPSSFPHDYPGKPSGALGPEWQKCECSHYIFRQTSRAAHALTSRPQISRSLNSYPMSPSPSHATSRETYLSTDPTTLTTRYSSGPSRNKMDLLQPMQVKAMNHGVSGSTAGQGPRVSLLRFSRYVVYL